MNHGDGVVAQILESLGIVITDVTGVELQAHCPAHKKRTGKEDANPSWYINADSGRHICFSCGFKGSLEYLIIVVKGYDDAEARDYIATLDTQIDIDGIREKLEFALRRDAAPVDRPLRKVPRSRLALFVPPPAWALAARGVTADACAAYGVLWDAERDAWITPLHDPRDLEMIGWQEKAQLDRWFKNAPPRMRKSDTLFGWPLAVPEDVDTIVAVESPLDAVRVYAVTGIVSVAFCGALVGSRQYELLRRFRRVIVAFDNPHRDAAGRKAVNEMRKADLPNVQYFAYGTTRAKDPGEMQSIDIERGIRAASLVVGGLRSHR